MGLLRRLLAGLVLAGFGLALALGTMEVGVRLLHLVPARFWEADPLLGTKHIAGMKGWWTQEEHEFSVPVQINSLGLRDVERPLAKPPGVFRILLVGDSYIEALQVPLEQSLGRQLESRLNAEAGGERYQVISAGVSGYGTASELLFYQTVGRRYDPDLVLLAFYPGNDVRNNSPVLEPTLRPEYDASGSLQRVVGRGAEAPAPKGLTQAMLSHWQTYQYVRKQLLTRNPAASNFLVRLGLMQQQAVREVPMADGVPVDYLVYAAAPPREWEEAWRHSEALISAFRAAAVGDGARFAVLIVTARDHIYSDSWSQVQAAYPEMARVKWDLDGPERHLTAWCTAQNLPCLQLSRSFAAHAKSGPRLHFVHDGHWTAAGHALAADEAAAFLRSAQLIPAN